MAVRSPALARLATTARLDSPVAISRTKQMDVMRLQCFSFDSETRSSMLLGGKTAKALGITVPLPLSGRADEVIE
jgi:hypothetical protein